MIGTRIAAMPPDLTRAHQALDCAVDAAYLEGTKRKSFATDAERVAFLFELYQQYTSLLHAANDNGKKAPQKKKKPG